MGLFDRLFGKKEEPKIEEVVKEALENLDLSEDIEPRPRSALIGGAHQYD